jgi:AraC-like DNA-binding protein
MPITLENPVRQRWSTADVDSRDALAYWVDTICKSFLEIDIDSPERERFRARLAQSDFGPAKLSIVEAETQTVHRTRARIARSRYATYFLLRLRSGELRLRQYGRESLMHAGDCVLIDCTEPYKLDCHSATRCLALRFPQDWLKRWIPAPESFAARPFASSAGWGAALSLCLANLDTDDEPELAVPAGLVAEEIATLLALAAGPGAQAATPSEKLLARLRRTLRDRCHEPDLTPATVAEAHGISKRYLHHLFAQAGSTFGQELMRLRMEFAHRMLSDRRFDNLSVSEIAARCGFLEPSHFARRFRQSFGVGPSGFRVARPG